MVKDKIKVNLNANQEVNIFSIGEILDKLKQLVSIGQIKSYLIQNVDEDGNIGKTSCYRNTEQLVIEFHNGQTLTIDCFCSGYSENIVLDIS